MKRYFYQIIFACIILVFSFFLIFYSIDAPDKQQEEADRTVNVYFSNESTVRTMPLDDYVAGVLCSEMPMSFQQEALKAQAVAIRTYTVKKIGSNIAEHHGADVCTDSTHCQAYKTREQYDDDNIYDKAIQIANETKDEIITYDGNPISAYYFSRSNGKTQNVAEVWGSSLPYLVSVDSPEELETAGTFSEKTIEKETFFQTIDLNCGARPENETVIYDLSQGGYVKYVTIGNVTVNGEEMRKLFGLRSSSFQITFDENNAHFRVQGYGHGVGMSQYGAEYLAESGKDYKSILTHFYQGTEIEKISI